MSQPGDESAQSALRQITAHDGLVAVTPLIGFGALMMVSLTTGADQAISRFWYATESGAWPGQESLFFRWCYEHGCKPAVCVGVGGLLVALPTFFFASWRPLRKPGLFLSLTLILGPGLLVNGVLKPKLARTRPSLEVSLVGPEQLARAGPGWQRGKLSFPSGHASMGFFLMTPALLLYRSRPIVSGAVFCGGLAYGSLIGVARIAQGAHYASDVLGSALCVWATALLVLAGRRLLMWSLLRFAPNTAPKLLRLPDEAAKKRAA